MSALIPLGQKEGPRLELKGADVLKDPEKIAREIVAMLNAEGGEVWVGLREEGNRAVAVEEIADPEGEQRRLLDFLGDVVEPSLSSREVSVDIRESDGGKLLCVVASPSRDRRPYAFLKRGGWHFVIRTGDRIRPMSQEEIFSKDSGSDLADLAESKVLADRKEVLASGLRLFWLCFEPGAKISLDIQDRKLEELLQNPQVTGNRLYGWNFSQFGYGPQIQGGKLITRTDEYRKVEIHREGKLVFTASLESLRWKGEETEIWPPILLEYIVSAFRMAGAIYREALRADEPVAVDLILSEVRGWKLRPGTPGPWFTAGRLRSTFTHADDLFLDKPLLYCCRDLLEEPDRCGLRLVERVYEVFGLRREDIPQLFDPKSGRLVFPE